MRQFGLIIVLFGAILTILLISQKQADQELKGNKQQVSIKSDKVSGSIENSDSSGLKVNSNKTPPIELKINALYTIPTNSELAYLWEDQYGCFSAKTEHVSLDRSISAWISAKCDFSWLSASDEIKAKWLRDNHYPNKSLLGELGFLSISDLEKHFSSTGDPLAAILISMKSFQAGNLDQATHWASQARANALDKAFPNRWLGEIQMLLGDGIENKLYELGQLHGEDITENDQYFSLIEQRNQKYELGLALLISAAKLGDDQLEAKVWEFIDSRRFIEDYDIVKMIRGALAGADSLMNYINPVCKH